MGNILDKLNYLAETKDDLKQALIEMGAEVTDETKFRDYVEKFKNATPDTDYILKSSLGKNPTIETLLGTLTLGRNDMICPRIEYDNDSTTSVAHYHIPFAPASYRSSGIEYVNVGIVDYSKVTTKKENITLAFELNYINPYVLILPNVVNLSMTRVRSSSSYTFTGGLVFGQRVTACNQSWLASTLSTTKRSVKFPKDFQVNKNVILYLNRIYIKEECLREMIQNLYNYTDGTNRYINLGSTNKAFLTTEEIELANSKGWVIT